MQSSQQSHIRVASKADSEDDAEAASQESDLNLGQGHSDDENNMKTGTNWNDGTRFRQVISDEDDVLDQINVMSGSPRDKLMTKTSSNSK